jgi:nicotinate-nucleotide adenylyltransferase
MSKRTIALFGGTFDPIHVGHLAAAQAVLDQGHVQEVVFVPAGQPPHKPAGARASAEDRWVMTLLATLDEPRFSVARWEVDRAGEPTYAVDTLALARADLGPDVDLVWVIGTDAMALIHTWHDAPRLFELTRFLVVARADYDEAGLRAELQRVAPWAPQATHVSFVHMPHVDASSTAIRAHLAKGEPVSGLAPAVETYIRRYGLYKGGAT